MVGKGQTKKSIQTVCVWSLIEIKERENERETVRDGGVGGEGRGEGVAKTSLPQWQVRE